MRTLSRAHRVSPVPPRFNAAAGRPLDRATRSLMESRFKADFAAVRVHTGTEAARAAAALSAAAFTTGPHIVFGAGPRTPDAAPGRALLSHELAHVVQQQRGVAHPDAVSRAGDADERAAGNAAAQVAAARPPGPLPAAMSGIQRQSLADLSLGLPQPPLVQSRAETVMESFLGMMWDAQSKQARPLRLTAVLLEGLRYVFPSGPPIGAITEWTSSRELLDQLRGKLPQTIDQNTQNVLERLPARESTLPPTGLKRDAEHASPKFVTPAPGLPPAPPDPRKPPEKGKDEEAAAKAALKAAAELFRKSKLGQELEKIGKEYVLTKEGAPLVAIIAAGVITFVAANDVSIPSTPDIKLADGIKLKIEAGFKPSEATPLLNDLVHGRTEPNQPERKLGVQATFTWEALADFIAGAAHFFVEVATWIGRGAVKVGTVIGEAANSALPEILGALGGAAVGAGIGALAGGGIGALIGASVGAGVGLGAALIKRLVSD
jgi:hypothetical protein